MSETEEHSVTQWFDGLREGDEAATREIYDRFIARLTGLARSRINARTRRGFDEEDAANEAMASFFRGVSDGRFEKLDDRHDLWRVLCTILRRKISGQLRRDSAVKRGGGTVGGESAMNHVGGFERVAADGVSPDELVSMDELTQELFGSLNDELLEQIAWKRLEGLTTAEIAADLDRSTRTIERKLQIVRMKWTDWADDLRVTTP